MLYWLFSTVRSDTRRPCLDGELQSSGWLQPLAGDGPARCGLRGVVTRRAVTVRLQGARTDLVGVSSRSKVIDHWYVDWIVHTCRNRASYAAGRFKTERVDRIPT